MFNPTAQKIALGAGCQELREVTAPGPLAPLSALLSSGPGPQSFWFCNQTINGKQVAIFLMDGSIVSYWGRTIKTNKFTFDDYDPTQDS